jgi:hypothetical protein
MEKAPLESIKVYSPIEDKDIRTNLGNSLIFKGSCYHESEYKEALKKHAEMFEYNFKFEGLKVVQFINMKKVIK